MTKKSKKAVWAVVPHGLGYAITRSGVGVDKWGQPAENQPPFVYRNMLIANEALGYILNSIRTDEVTAAQIADDEQFEDSKG